MRIKAKIEQNRRDFTADYECEACGHVVRGRGYDDANFHHNVIPEMECEKCGATGSTTRSDPTVPEGIVL
jgi:primosomal protein N'